MSQGSYERAAILLSNMHDQYSFFLTNVLNTDKNSVFKQQWTKNLLNQHLWEYDLLDTDSLADMHIPMQKYQYDFWLQI